jgi:hypothetical protein
MKDAIKAPSVFQGAERGHPLRLDPIWMQLGARVKINILLKISTGAIPCDALQSVTIEENRS